MLRILLSDFSNISRSACLLRQASLFNCLNLTKKSLPCLLYGLQNINGQIRFLNVKFHFTFHFNFIPEYDISTSAQSGTDLSKLWISICGWGHSSKDLTTGGFDAINCAESLAGKCRFWHPTMRIFASLVARSNVISLQIRLTGDFTVFPLRHDVSKQSTRDYADTLQTHQHS